MDEMDHWPVARQAEYHRKGMEKAIRDASNRAEADYRAEHPQAGRLSTFLNVSVYGKRPKGFHDFPVEVVRMFLDSPRTVAQTNDAIIAAHAPKWLPYVLSKNVMAKAFTPPQAAKVAALLSGGGKGLDLARHGTLSKVKLALRAMAGPGGVATDYLVPIALGTDYVTIAGNQFAVTQHKNGYGRIRIGRRWLRCDVLEAALQCV